ncbi:MAG: hypothetical protein HQM10_16625 [Candidatus Riflebacteria bacterium]|nr:hypothetical protein [Candidatus Riflebacteria bacterium]
MYAIEFEATIENGMIPIPPQYLALLQPRLKVIVMQEDPTEKLVQAPLHRNQKEEFLASLARHRFDLPSNYRFKREELYDRI